MLQTNSRTHKKILSKTPSINKPLKYCFGVTLIEMMVSISIMSIITSIALPNFNEFVVKMRVDNEISRLSRLLLTARNHAINSQSNVIICALENTSTCTENWHKELSVFIDNNGNRRFDSVENERLITTKGPIKHDDILIYGKYRTQIIYQPTGHLFGLGNGTFRYCPEGYEDKSRGIIIARSGRFYATTDSNHDGIDETRSNVKIKCN